MLREKATSQQKEYEIVLLEELVPEDHLLRKIDDYSGAAERPVRRCLSNLSGAG